MPSSVGPLNVLEDGNPDGSGIRTRPVYFSWCWAKVARVTTTRVGLPRKGPKSNLDAG
jgi:hypothetical protein